MRLQTADASACPFGSLIQKCGSSGAAAVSKPLLEFSMVWHLNHDAGLPFYARCSLRLYDVSVCYCPNVAYAILLLRFHWNNIPLEAMSLPASSPLSLVLNFSFYTFGFS